MNPKVGIAWWYPRKGCEILHLVVIDLNAQLPSGDSDP
jgi:hypothetical protein